jgi:hypothetical protein
MEIRRIMAHGQPGKNVRFYLKIAKEKTTEV